MKNLFFVVTVLCGLLAACDDEISLEDELEVLVESETVQLDTICENGGCDTLNAVQFTLALDAANASSENDTVQFLQYRVDYQLPQLKKKIPFFAAPLDIVLSKGDETVFNIQIAGSKQRALVFNQVGGREVNGIARVTLAGYDELDDRVNFEFTFHVALGDFITGDVSHGTQEGE
ncbi:MAG: hypothetical protein JXR76_10335 [Deltaproteobacteria bacterium]|nr:hypothetical protein [Deltaproteobacteria bacterium]